MGVNNLTEYCLAVYYSYLATYAVSNLILPCHGRLAPVIPRGG